MDIDEVLRRLGGVATRQDLVRATSRKEFDRAVRAGGVVRDGHGRYSLPVAAEAVRAANALSGVVSDLSAAMHYGWEVKTPPRLPHVTVRRNRVIDEDRRAGIRLRRANLSSAQVNGMFTSVDRTLVDCLRALPFDEALAVADSALRHRSVGKARLIEIADGIKGPGAPQARRVAREATARAANPFESVLRAIALEVPGLDVQPQVVIADEHGSGRPDLVDRARRLVVEAESHTWHSRRGALRRDCRRYTRLVLLGWRVLRFAWEDVMFHDDYVRACLVAAAELAPGGAGSTPEGGAAA